MEGYTRIINECCFAGKKFKRNQKRFAMKVNRILFIIAGILRSLVAGIVALFTFIIFAIRSLIKNMFLASPEMIDSLIKELVTIDTKYEYLSQNDIEQNVDFIIGIVDKLCLVALIWVLIVVALAVFSFICGKKCKSNMNIVNWQTITMVIVSWVCPLATISAILTTIAVFYKKKPKVNKIGDPVIDIEGE